MLLTKLLEEVYPYDKEIPLELLRTYDFETVLEKAVQKIMSVPSNPQLASMMLITYAPSVLYSVNSRMRNVTDTVHKHLLEILIADVLNYLIGDLLKKSNQPSTDLKKLKISLENASDLENYNFSDLLQLLKYDKLETSYPTDKTKAPKIFWYAWKALAHDLDSIAERLIKQHSIKSVKEFRKLFDEYHPIDLRVFFSRDSIHFLIVLFDQMKAKRLVSPRGCNGHFHPIQVYGVDFDNKVLFTTEAKLIKSSLKNDPEKLQNLVGKANEWLAGITPRTTSDLPLAKDRKISKSKN